MGFHRLTIPLLSLLCLAVSCGPGLAQNPIPESETSLATYQRVSDQLRIELQKKHLELGRPIYIQIFKEERQLEIWVENGLTYTLFKSYTICDFSGELGPKLKEGDNQSPEGFYTVDVRQLNPFSNYHLSFNVGFPNEYDQRLQRTGNSIMVHGRCASAGCFAMTDFRMDEIYTLAAQAIAGGQKAFPVHIFPFKMTWENMARHAGNPWMGFWENLKQGYDHFQGFRSPPQVAVQEDRYVFQPLPTLLFGGDHLTSVSEKRYAGYRKTAKETSSL